LVEAEGEMKTIFSMYNILDLMMGFWGVGFDIFGVEKVQTIDFSRSGSKYVYVLCVCVVLGCTVKAVQIPLFLEYLQYLGQNRM